MSEEKIKLLLATGSEVLDTRLKQNFQSSASIEVIGTIQTCEGVMDVVERTKADTIFISEALVGGTLTVRQVLLQLRPRFPRLHIIYFLRNENLEEERFAYHFSIFDLFFGKFKPSDLEYAILHPKKFEDVAERVQILEGGASKKDTIGPIDPDVLSTIDETTYTRISSPSSREEPIYQQIVAFWSALDKEGVTFSIVNTALLLATRPDLKILLLDFNTKNPNIHLYFGSLFEGHKSLSAILQDIEKDDEIDASNLDDYLITHPVYQNLKILPGALLKENPTEPELYAKAFDLILEAAQKNNFSTILVDINSGLNDPFTIHILNKVHRILFHATEDPGTLNAASRLFDNEAGAFTLNLLDRKKVFTVITRSFEETAFNYRTHLEYHIQIPTISSIPYKEYVLESLYKGEPLLSKPPTPEMYEPFVFIANTVHKKIFTNPIKSKKTLLSSNNKNNPTSKRKITDFFGKNKTRS